MGIPAPSVTGSDHPTDKTNTPSKDNTIRTIVQAPRPAQQDAKAATNTTGSPLGWIPLGLEGHQQAAPPSTTTPTSRLANPTVKRGAEIWRQSSLIDQGKLAKLSKRPKIAKHSSQLDMLAKLKRLGTFDKDAEHEFLVSCVELRGGEEKRGGRAQPQQQRKVNRADPCALRHVPPC